MPIHVGLIELVERMPRSRVVLGGDLMLDRYLYGNAERLSPEAPVPVLHYQREETRLGGAGGVAAMLAALGADVRLVGAVGADDAGRQVRRRQLRDYALADLPRDGGGNGRDVLVIQAHHLLGVAVLGEADEAHLGDRRPVRHLDQQVV